MLRPCLECGTPTRKTRCPQHTSQLNRERGSSTQRGYGSRWQRIRNAYIARHPLCEWPLCNEPAIDVDHVRPQRAGGTHERTNLQSLCRPHHAQKTQADMTRWPHSATP